MAAQDEHTPQPLSDAADDIAIDIRRVSKRFKLYHNAVLGPLKDLLFFWRKGAYYRDFVAVKDISLQVKRGEVVGIVGPNGAGKTTLLKMIAGLLLIDSGSISVRGRVISENLDLEDAALTTLCERVIRNYDPCISCSTHFLTLTVHHT